MIRESLSRSHSESLYETPNKYKDEEEEDDEPRQPVKEIGRFLQLWKDHTAKQLLGELEEVKETSGIELQEQESTIGNEDSETHLD